MADLPRPSNRPWVAIQRNPRSGSGRARGELKELSRRLKSLGYHVRMFADRDRLDAVIAAAERKPVAVVAAGGDGTIGSVANRIQGIPIAVLPLGTENLIARHFGIRRSGAQVADIIASGRRVQIDTALLNGQRFLIVAGFGLDATVAHRLHEVRTGTISHLTYIKPIVSTFRRYHYVPMRVYVDDNSEPLVGYQVMVVNLPAYAMRMPFAADARGDDGLLDIRVFGRGSTFQMLKYCYKVSRRRHESLPDVYCARAKSVRVEADEPVLAQADGDPAGTTPATIELEPGTVEFFVP